MVSVSAVCTLRTRREKRGSGFRVQGSGFRVHLFGNHFPDHVEEAEDEREDQRVARRQHCWYQPPRQTSDLP